MADYKNLKPVSDYQTKVDAYKRSLAAWEASAKPYFDKVAKGNLQTSHPPKYDVPTKPHDPSDKDPIPVMTDILADMKEKPARLAGMYGFLPNQPSDGAFNILYAKEMRRAGIPDKVVQGITAFETEGAGGSIQQPVNTDPETKKKVALSSALGPAQLLNPNSVEMMSKHGLQFAARLERDHPDLANTVRAMQKDAAQVTADFAAYKADHSKLPKYMTDDIAFSSVTRDASQRGFKEWDFYKSFAKTDKGRAMHLTNMDGRIGPMMQAQKLLDEMRVKWDPAQGKLVDTATGKSPPANVLNDPVAWEMRNLLGREQAEKALDPKNSQYSVANFIDMKGYEGNGTVRDKTAGQLIKSMGSDMESFLGKKGAQAFLDIYNRPDVQAIKPGSGAMLAEAKPAVKTPDQQQPATPAEAAKAHTGFSQQSLKKLLSIGRP